MKRIIRIIWFTIKLHIARLLLLDEGIGYRRTAWMYKQKWRLIHDVCIIIMNTKFFLCLQIVNIGLHRPMHEPGLLCYTKRPIICSWRLYVGQHCTKPIIIAYFDLYEVHKPRVVCVCGGWSWRLYVGQHCTKPGFIAYFDLWGIQIFSQIPSKHFEQLPFRRFFFLGGWGWGRRVGWWWGKTVTVCDHQCKQDNNLLSECRRERMVL